jgi:hypothetical protein
MSQIESVKRNARDIIRNRVLERKKQKEIQNKTNANTLKRKEKTQLGPKRMTKYRGKMDDLTLVRAPQLMCTQEGEEYFRKDGKYYDVTTLELVARTRPDGKILFQPKKATLKRRKELNQITKAEAKTETKTGTRAKQMTKYRGKMDDLTLVRAPQLVGIQEGEEYFHKDGKYYDVTTLELVARTKPNGKIP